MTSHGFTSKLGPWFTAEMVWQKVVDPVQLQACRIPWGFPSKKNQSERSLFGKNPYHIDRHSSSYHQPIAAVGQGNPKKRSRRPTGVFGNPKTAHKPKHAQNATPKHWGGGRQIQPGSCHHFMYGQMSGSLCLPSSMAEVYGYPMIYIVIYCV